jgi:Uma2 family endonuclease
VPISRCVCELSPKDTQEIKNSIQFPTLIVEVLSPSTEMHDRVRKFRFYQQCLTIKEYVLINQYRKEVEIYSRIDAEWKYRIYTSGDEIQLVNLNITFHIDLLYENAILPEEAE